MNDKDAAALKTAIRQKLDAVASEHRLGHQDAYANRYSMRSAHDAPVELMFEKGKDTPPYLWVLAEHAAPLAQTGLEQEFYSKDDLYKTPAKGGGKQYGRHSALEKMTWLGKADLVRFTIGSTVELDQILGVLSQVKKKGAQ